SFSSIFPYIFSIITLTFSQHQHRVLPLHFLNNNLFFSLNINTGFFSYIFSIIIFFFSLNINTGFLPLHFLNNNPFFSININTGFFPYIFSRFFSFFFSIFFFLYFLNYSFVSHHTFPLYLTSQYGSLTKHQKNKKKFNHYH